MRAALDHLVVAAGTLAGGVSHIETSLGVEMQPGGKHHEFGTHNALLSLGHTAYLEVIAVDPDAPLPQRPRWFSLDTDSMRARLAHGPALVHWVARVEAIEAADEAAHGQAMELARGENRWSLTVPADGSLPLGGVLPSLISWHTPPPPTRLQDHGIRLSRLALATPEPAALRAWLAALGLREAVVVEAGAPSLVAVLESLGGLVTLTG